MMGPVIKTPDGEIELGEDSLDGVEEVEVEIVDPGDEYDDGGMDVEIEEVAHGDNLVETMDEDQCRRISNQIIEDYNNDVQSRSEWAKAYVKGLDLLGLKIEERATPWQGASGVFHPVMMESIIRFQAQAMGELLPAQGPARTKIPGKQTKERLEQAQRVEREMNFQTTENMCEYREEMEQLLFHLPMAGSAFKKIYYDPIDERPAAMFVPAEDLVVSYGATSLIKAERFTHVIKKTLDEIEELMDVGFYADMDLSDPVHEGNDIEQAYDELSGETPSYTNDTRHTLLECHCMLKLDEDDDGPACPYVATVEKTSGKLLALRKNWRESDKRKRKVMHFVHYKYLPGLGFYGIGLIHLLGGLTKTATSILRQLIDSGTLANLPAGFKTRGLRTKGDNAPFRPGEFRDVDVPAGSIREHIELIPFKEPSSTLYQLLNGVIDEARRVGSVAETELTNLNKEMPVGTAFAILERQMKVMTGVQARLHAALKNELKLLHGIISRNMGDAYDWDDENMFSRKQDFRSKVEVIPVSNPNASTTAQKVVSYQAAIDLAAKAPNLYNMGKLHRQMLDVLQIDNADEIVKLPEDIKPADPVTENMAILKQEPVKAFMYQDHEAHIKVHMAAAQDPKIQQIVGQSPFASAIQSAMSSHIAEHVAMEYRKQIEKQLGTPLPDQDEPMPEDVEREVSRLAQAAADKLLQRNMSEAQAQKAQEEAKDPLNIIQKKELEIKERKLKHEIEMDKLRIELEAFSKGSNLAHQKNRLDSEEARAAAKIAIEIANSQSGEDKTGLEILRLAVEQVKRLQESGTLDNTDSTGKGKDNGSEGS